MSKQESHVYKEYIDSMMENKGYFGVTYPSSLRKVVEAAVVSWKDFCALPSEVKKRFPYSNDDHAADGVGYELKMGKASSGDLKENFDFTLADEKLLETSASRINNPIISALIKDAAALVRNIQPLAIEFARAVEKEYGISGFVEKVRASEPIFFLRFNHYFGAKEVGGEIAHHHADRSAFTFHLHESHPGLQYLAIDRKWRNMPIENDTTLVIPGMQLQFHSRGNVKALCHRVISNEETAKRGRYSLVCFIHLKDSPTFNKEKYGSQQGLSAGFNYTIDHDEFEKMFYYYAQSSVKGPKSKPKT